MITEQMSVDEMMADVFGRPRDPRSDAYKAGMRATFDRKKNGRKVTCPYRIGTAEADAFFSGTDHGALIWDQNISQIE